jgi:hypothetical protein
MTPVTMGGPTCAIHRPGAGTDAFARRDLVFRCDSESAAA